MGDKPAAGATAPRARDPARSGPAPGSHLGSAWPGPVPLAPGSGHARGVMRHAPGRSGHARGRHTPRPGRRAAERQGEGGGSVVVEEVVGPAPWERGGPFVLGWHRHAAPQDVCSPAVRGVCQPKRPEM
ncbi:hypothetical protein GCM10010271_23300 [Streptomyces kurssanovii]|nr:hypothetical protein GCM10010271_23300 [Streptomyces kurssanovii]